MKLLSSLELTGFIKERQAKAVRGLRQAYHIQPKLVIIATVENQVIETYMRMKKNYGADILIEVEILRIKQSEVVAAITRLNDDPSVHGVIVQLPLENMAQADEILNKIKPEKDVDGLGEKPIFDPATPTAILWLLSGHNIDLKDRKVVLVGRGKLVGRPLERMLQNSGVNVRMLGRSDDVKTEVATADVIVTATGSPSVLTSAMIPRNAVVVDAGVAVEEGVTVGDLAPDVYEREDLLVTPAKGGVGPLTVCALFENVITAAKHTAGIKS